MRMSSENAFAQNLLLRDRRHTTYVESFEFDKKECDSEL